jgi:hypothetical protein
MDQWNQVNNGICSGSGLAIENTKAEGIQAGGGLNIEVP